VTRVVTTRTTFTGGELDPRLLGRFDLRAYDNGARRLRNVVIHPTGGVSRRPGLAHVAELPGPGRLIPFESGPEGALLLVLTHFRLDVYQDGQHIADAEAEWSEEQLAGLTWLQRERELLVCHPGVPPKRVFRDLDGFWVVRDLAWWETTDPVPQPFARYAADDVALETDGTTGTVQVTVSHPVFVAEHLGVVFRKQNRQIRITNVQTPTTAQGLVLEELVDAEATFVWDEAAFSLARGYPAAIAMHQNRLVLGGPRDHGNRLWLSRTGRHLDFDTGTGLDDEAIAFALDAPRSHAIRALFAGRHLQVFTTDSEWIVHGTPLTPTSIQIQRQTAIGSHPSRQIPPRDIDGATLFCGASGRELREFLFTDTEQAYQAADLALLSRHLLQDPVDQDFDRARRVLLIVNADGTVASLTIDRNSDVVAWSRLETEGRVRSVAVAREGTMLLVERDGIARLERLDEALPVDAGVRLEHTDPVAEVAGLDHLEGAVVKLLADGRPEGDRTVTAGKIALPRPAREVVVGLPFTHLVEPMPPAFAAGGGASQDPLYRPVRVAFRVLETRALRVDLGDGPRLLPQGRVGDGVLDTPPAPFTGDLVVRALGWRRGIATPPWRLEQDDPLACTLLSVTLEAKVNA
jgi:hypothetical protein